MRMPRQPSQHSRSDWSSMDGRPAPQGMYDPRNEHDACGVGFVATLTGEAEPRAGRAGAHRSAQPGAPRRHRLRARLGRRRRHPAPGPGRLPPRGRRLRAARGRLATPSASPSCPTDDAAEAAVSRIETIAAEEGLTVLGWREVPVAPELLGATARSTMPAFRQLFVADADGASARASTSTARPSCCASAPSARPASTSPRSPRARSSTRAC